jgi:hypothetical protein
VGTGNTLAREAETLGFDLPQTAEERRRSDVVKRQRRSRHSRRAQGMRAEAESWADAGELDMRTVADISGSLRQFLVHELQLCDSKLTREAVMEVFLDAEEVRCHLPEHYPSAEDAKVHFQIIQSLRDRLHAVKGVQTFDMLAYKGALLDVVVEGDIRGMRRAIGRVLQVRPENI